LRFDEAAEPIAVGGTLYIPNNSTDTLSAVDTRSGDLEWTYFADAPIRFAPVADESNVYFVADDGCLYSVSQKTGKLNWKVQGGPTERWLLGNSRLISSWPARGGPVLHEGKIYFTTSIWSFMGIFVHCVDADTGTTVWTNSGDGTNYTVQPHGAPAFANVVPQGHLSLTNGKLVVPGGRSMPAVYAADTGKQVFFNYDKRNGGHYVTAGDNFFYMPGATYDCDRGAEVDKRAPVVGDSETVVFLNGSEIEVASAKASFQEVETKDRKGKVVKTKKLVRPTIFKGKIDGVVPNRILVRAGNRLYGTGSDGNVICVDLEKVKNKESNSGFAIGKTARPIFTMLAASDRLFAVDVDNQLYSFGAGSGDPVHHAIPSVKLQPIPFATIQAVDDMLEATKANDGYCFVLGFRNTHIIDTLLEQTKLTVIAIDSDPTVVSQARKRWVITGKYGSRVSALRGNPLEISLPQYAANLVISGRPEQLASEPAQLAKRLEHIMRPYDGQAYFKIDGSSLSLDEKQFRQKKIDDAWQVTRYAELPQTDDWSHQYGNASQTGISGDHVVKAPLGLLWFGGTSHDGILPRHGHGPSPQVAGGRLFIEGPDKMRAVDIYTGRLLWEKELPKVGQYYNNTSHFPGANEIGSNYVSMADAVYVVYGQALLQLDPATGDEVRRFELSGESETPYWGYLAATDDYLIATSSPVQVYSKTGKGKGKPSPELADNETEIIKRNATWQFLAGSDPAANWTTSSKTGVGWKSAAAGFGYGDGDDKTEIAMKNKFSRVYIRAPFDIADPKKIDKLILRLNYDDAFIAYLNGKEVTRKGIQKGSGKNVTKISSHEAEKFESFTIDKSQLRTGINILAIEGHNQTIGSSDFTLDPYLVTTTPKKSNGSATLKPQPRASISTAMAQVRYASGSRRLVVFDRKTGKQLWSRDAKLNFRHNNIAAHDQRLFCIDSLTAAKRTALERRGVDVAQFAPKLYAINLRSGEVEWETAESIFGTFLNYSAEHDILLQAGSRSRDRAVDEIGKGMTGYRGSTGERLWHDPDITYGGPCLVWKDTILTNGTGGYAVDLKTGKKTGWTYNRQYGCNTAIGGQNLLTFRSGAAGICDLANDGGTGNLGGFRSSCTSNLIVANGLLNAPDYTRTCSCAYQNQTSLALIHMPDAELWTFGATDNKTRWGVNFGAPGDRRDKEGILWTDFPSVGGLSPDRKITIDGTVTYKRRHTSTIASDNLPWVGASALEGEATIKITNPLTKSKSPGKIQLVFADSSLAKANERVFNIYVNDKLVAEKLDVNQKVGAGKTLVIEHNVESGETIEIRLESSAGSKLPPMLSGISLTQAE
jgi:outer membrane protein assembly factor BamB